MVSQAIIDVAKKKMKIKQSNYCMSFVSTLWKGEVIMVCYNNLAKEISNVFCMQNLDEDDISNLETLIKHNILLDNVL